MGGGVGWLISEPRAKGGEGNQAPEFDWMGGSPTGTGTFRYMLSATGHGFVHACSKHAHIAPLYGVGGSTASFHKYCGLIPLLLTFYRHLI